MRRFLAVVTVLLAALSLSLVVAGQSARAQEGGYLYGGPHPIHPDAGGGFCYTADAHSHDYPVDPNIAYLYRNYNGYQHFVGNVYDFGYEGEAFPYYGHHPVPSVDSYCYLNGLHYHFFLPPPTYATSYVVYNGYYYYRGVFAPGYYSYRSPYYRARLSYWYLPAYRMYHQRYAVARRTYARPASVAYIQRQPRISYQPRGGAHVNVNRGRPIVPAPQPARPPLGNITRPTPGFDTVRRPSPTSTPAYRYNTQRPNTYDTHYRQPQATQPVRPQVTQPVRPQFTQPVRPQPQTRPQPQPPQPRPTQFTRPQQPQLPTRPSQPQPTKRNDRTTWRR